MIQQTAHLLFLVVTSAPIGGQSLRDVSREYRIETYDTFRQQRPEFDRRQQLGVEATRRWKEAKFDAQLRDRIVEWYVESTDATRNSVNLPELPGEPSLASQKEVAAQEAETRTNALTSVNAADAIHSSNPTELTLPTEPATRKTSIVTDDRFIETNQDRDTSDTAKILGSVGRALTRALINHQAHGEVASSVDFPVELDSEDSSDGDDKLTIE